MPLYKVISEAPQAKVRRVRIVEARDAIEAVNQRRTLPCREEYADVIDWGEEGRAEKTMPVEEEPDP